jgi:uncharacterized protein YndB with AHSA1/START domain
MTGTTMAKEFECERDGIVIGGPASDGLTLRLKRVLSSNREMVYGALTDQAQLAKWWGPRGFTAPHVEFDPRVGGSYRIAMQPPDGELFQLSGEFREVDPPARLAYTFRWHPPDPDDRETAVRLSLQKQGEGTELLLSQGEFATEQRLALHEEGWTESLDRLAQLLVEAEAVRRAGFTTQGPTRFPSNRPDPTRRSNDVQRYP